MLLRRLEPIKIWVHLKMEAAGSFKTPVNVYQTTRRKLPHRSLNICRRDGFKYHTRIGQFTFFPSVYGCVNERIMGKSCLFVHLLHLTRCLLEFLWNRIFLYIKIFQPSVMSVRRCWRLPLDMESKRLPLDMESNWRYWVSTREYTSKGRLGRGGQQLLTVYSSVSRNVTQGRRLK